MRSEALAQYRARAHANNSESEIFGQGLPPSPLQSHLVGLHKLLRLGSPNSTVMAVAEYHMRQIAMSTPVVEDRDRFPRPPGYEITLGDIHKALVRLTEQGAHPGSIDWVLHKQIVWEDGEHYDGNH